MRVAAADAVLVCGRPLFGRRVSACVPRRFFRRDHVVEKSRWQENTPGQTDYT